MVITDVVLQSPPEVPVLCKYCLWKPLISSFTTTAEWLYFLPYTKFLRLIIDLLYGVHNVCPSLFCRFIELSSVNDCRIDPQFSADLCLQLCSSVFTGRLFSLKSFHIYKIYIYTSFEDLSLSCPGLNSAEKSWF